MAGLSLESYVQSANTVLLGELDYTLPNSAPYVRDRRSVQYLTSASGTFTSSNVRNFTIPITSQGEFADLSTLRLSFRIKNTHPVADGVIGGTRTVHRLKLKSGPWSCISRLRVYVGGQIVEDMTNYGRLHEMFSMLAPKDYHPMNGLFSTGMAHGTTGRDPLQHATIANGDTLTVSMQLCSGLLQCGKYFPLKEAGGIQIEIELAQPDACCVTTTGTTSDNDFYNAATAVAGGAATVVYTTSFEIQDPRIVCDVLSLDPHLTDQYAKLMLEGKALTIRTNQFVTRS